MARAAVFVPDLLFGSNVIGALQAGGHDPELITDASELAAALAGADVLIVDLTADAAARIELARSTLRAPSPKTLAFFSHVESHVRDAAQQAGFDLVVPRSRMARAAAALVTELTG